MGRYADGRSKKIELDCEPDPHGPQTIRDAVTRQLSTPQPLTKEDQEAIAANGGKFVMRPRAEDMADPGKVAAVFGIDPAEALAERVLALMEIHGDPRPHLIELFRDTFK